MNKLNKTAKELFKDLKGIIDIPNLINYLKGLGYSTVFYNTKEGDHILEAYKLPLNPDKSFTYCGITQIVFINGNLPTQNKIYSLLHELGHILLDDIDDDKCYLKDNRALENQAEAFAYAVLNYKRDNTVLHSVICTILASVISATAVYNFRPVVEEYSSPVTVPVVQTTEELEQLFIEEPVSELVQITKTGSKYHRPSCRYVKNKDCTSLTTEEAQKNYEPCRVCNP